MSSGLAEIIGEDWEELEIGCERDLEIGFSLNPFKAVRNLGRTVKKVKAATIDKIPVVSDVAKFTTQKANLALTPQRLAFGAAKGFVTGGTKGALSGFTHEVKVTGREGKRFVQNPVVRYGTKGAALVFPPLVPVAAGVEAANQAIAAAEHRDPIKAAFALTTIANTAAAAAGGDPDAARAMSVIKAVREGNIIPQNIPKGAMNFTKAISIPGVSKTSIGNAVKLLNAAKGNAPATIVKQAKAAVSKTIAAARKGDPRAKKAAAVLAVVHTAQKSGIRSLVRGTAGKAKRASTGSQFKGAYLVDSKGRVVKGNFKAL